MTNTFTYESSLSSRYASKEMSYLFSDQNKYTTWRKLWVALAEAEQSLGLSITDTQIDSMKKNLHELDLHLVAEYEKKLKHDVMAHLHAFGDVCHEAKGILHLGATSCYITDNTDLIQMKSGLEILHHKILVCIRSLNEFAKKYASLACLSFTHFQPAQPTTVGKRACLWIQDLLMDLHDIEEKMHGLRFLGAKGATGTQASFLSLFSGDHNKVKQLDLILAKKLGFERLMPISGQTYTRKQDVRVVSALSNFAATAHKIASDIRLLSHLKELQESFGENQVGSSAMPYKRNPVKSERICGLARFLISIAENPLYTTATQWLERTLDDSSNRRLCIPEAFLTADSVANLLILVLDGLIVNPMKIHKNLFNELPFMATENIIMLCAKKGADRQQLHEALRKHSIQVLESIDQGGSSSELIDKILSDPLFAITREELSMLMKEEQFVGRAPEQVKEFLHEEVHPILKKFEHLTEYKPLVFV
ncbi:MAG: adenylosuccinate lyase [Chlamydiae bacterium]|nr:adenylosuccinate lyase [Chlamydiota bacterium]